MDFPKSPSLMMRLIELGSHPDSIILDFFSGSATTAQGVMEANAIDGGSRRFILVQLGEEIPSESAAAQAGFSTIAELGIERLRRAGTALINKGFDLQSKIDVGFRVLHVDSSNMSDVLRTPDEIDQDDLLEAVDNVKSDREDPEDLLFEEMIHSGLDLTLPIHQEVILGKRILLVGENPNTLIACFDEGVNEDLVKELAKMHPSRILFKDTSYSTDAAKINTEQIFKQISPDTAIRSV